MWCGFGVVLWYLHRKIRLTELSVGLSWVWQYITEQISISNAVKTILNGAELCQAQAKLS